MRIRMAGIVFAMLGGPLAVAQTLRYEGTIQGGIAATSNTLGLSKESNANGPGLLPAIGTFITTDALSVDDVPANGGNPWETGTTNDWRKNRSAGAPLVLGVQSEVVYAELVWGGSYQYGTEDVSAFLDTSVTLSFGSAAVAVPPDAATALTISQAALAGGQINYYLRSADVTAFVASNGAGVYAVSGVPATQDAAVNSIQAAGWSLAVVYRSAGGTRAISLFVGGGFVEPGGTPYDTTISGFCAPPSGVTGALVTASAFGGDASLTGDQLVIAPSTLDTFVPLDGVYNPAGNFFASQISDYGSLATGGTAGMKNHDAAAGINASGARQGWDLTTVFASSDDGQFASSQTTAVVRAQTSGDAFVPALLGFSVYVHAPYIFGGNGIFISPSSPPVGTDLTGSLVIDNDGERDATDAVLALTLPAGLTITAFAIDGTPGDANGAAVTNASLAAGAPLGTIAAGGSITITLTIATGTTAPGFITLAPIVSYGFQSCPTSGALTGSVALAQTSFELLPEGGDPGNEDDDDAYGACACQLSTPTAASLSLPFALLACLAVALRRRR